MKRLFHLLKKIYKVLFIKEVRDCFIQYIRTSEQAVQGNCDEAIKSYHLIMQKGIVPDRLIYKKLGIAYYWDNRFDEAETAFRKSLELCMTKKEYDGQLYKYLGNVSLKQGKFKDALFFYERAIQFGKNGKLNQILTSLEYVNDMKNMLEEHKEELPFLTIYYEQNKHKFVKNK
ncbi:MAG: tetratricopeptide repeat protein [Sedimentisphaerales bacterium]